MLAREVIRSLYAYSAWANDRVLDTAEQLDREAFVADRDGVGSVRDILVHIASAQWAYLQRWQGNSPRALWDPADYPDVAALRPRWQAVESATANYIGGLEQAELGRIVSYINFQGETWAYPLWQQMLHQANHATQHRSEVALLLTRFGHSPGMLDFLYYVDIGEPGSAETMLA